MTTTKIPTLKPNIAQISFGYSETVIMPMKDAITIMAALSNAERFTSEYQKPITIGGKLPDLKLTPLTHDEYLEGKMNYLLESEETKE
jgi:hypothetical protein